MKKPADLGGEAEPKNPPGASTDGGESVPIESSIEMEAFRAVLIEGVEEMWGPGW